MTYLTYIFWALINKKNCPKKKEKSNMNMNSTVAAFWILEKKFSFDFYLTTSKIGLQKCEAKTLEVSRSVTYWLRRQKFRIVPPLGTWEIPSIDTILDLSLQLLQNKTHPSLSSYSVSRVDFTKKAEEAWFWHYSRLLFRNSPKGMIYDNGLHQIAMNYLFTNYKDYHPRWIV